ncbi:MAG: HlyD family efflux transporter periplasmic adaptor subunit [Azospirillaceae bacterium]
MSAAVGSGAAGGGESAALPALRDDLALLPAPHDADGAPAWTIWDPVRNRYFRIGRVARALMAAWNPRDPGAMARAVAAETGAAPDGRQLADFVAFLRLNELVAESGPEHRARLARRAAAEHPPFWKRAMTRYLFARIPLVRPDAFLDATEPLVRPLYSRAVAIAVVLAGVVGVLLASRQIDAFFATFAYFHSPAGIAWFALGLIGAKVLHELAHAYTAKRYGCRVHGMGVAFLVLWPVLYTDVTDAWKLADRRRRLAIGAAGMIAELGLAALATLAWSFLPDGPARSAAFLIATVTWVMTLAVNLNPLMKFDGYYLLADLLGVDNLQARGFAVGRWRLREALFGFGEPPPEPMSPRLRRILVVYAWSAWLWRLVLFVTIALLVYHFVVKVVGILLAVVELAWFVARPVRDELAQWWARRDRIRPTRNLALTLLVLAGGLAVLVVPWQDRIAVPAVVEAAGASALYAPVPGRIAALPVARGERVAAGAPVVVLESPDLVAEIALARRRALLLARLIERRAAGAQAPDTVGVLESELAAERATLEGLEARAARLVVRAPIDGRLVERDPALRPGLWVAADRPLGRVVDSRAARATAYLPESALDRVAVGGRARLTPADSTRPAIAARIDSIERVAVARLDRPLLASTEGGPIAARADSQGRPVPETALYRVVLAPEPGTQAPERVIRATARLEADPASPAGRLARTVAAVLIRESGF